MKTALVPVQPHQQLLVTVPDPDASALIAAFLSGRNARTIAAYRQDLESFRLFLKVWTIDQAAGLLLGGGHGKANLTALRYKGALMEMGLSPATINRRLAALRSLVKLARTIGMIGWELEVANCKSEAYRDTRGPGRSGFRSLLQEASARDSAKAVRDRALLHFLHDLALRRGEIVALDFEDLDLENGTVSVMGKGRTQKEKLSLPEPTKAALRDWLLVRGTAPGPLFLNFDRAGKGEGRLTGTGLYLIVRRLGERVGIKTRPHGLRHTAITEACIAARENGIGLEEVLDFSRHANVRTLMIYRDRERNVQGRLAALVAAG